MLFPGDVTIFTHKAKITIKDTKNMQNEKKGRQMGAMRYNSHTKERANRIDHTPLRLAQNPIVVQKTHKTKVYICNKRKRKIQKHCFHILRSGTLPTPNSAVRPPECFLNPNKELQIVSFFRT